MSRRRLGVVLLVPPPFDREIEGLRRALGDPSLGRVAPHLTLVPPVNVREDRLGQALAVLRRAAAATTPLTLALGPPASFLPAVPVIHLPAGGDDRSTTALARLRVAVFADPLARPLTHPFEPHVTLADVPQVGIPAALTTLAGYVVEVTFTSVHLLEEGPGRVWQPIAEAPFGPPAVVARGPMQVELTVTALLDPEARHLLDQERGGEPDTDGEREREWERGDALVVTARRGGHVVGVAEGVVVGSEARLLRLVVDRAERGTGVGSHLVAAFRAAATARGCGRAVAEVTRGSRAERFLRSRGWVGGEGRGDAVLLTCPL